MEENGRLVQFLYNEDREVVAEKDYSGNLIRYIRGLGLISSDSENAKTYYHYVCDEQGSVSHIIRGEDKESGVSEQGREQDRILNQYEYDAFGNTISCKEQVENRFRYQGEQYDPITRQYYLRARYYNPVIGRFIQEDTYYGDGLNLYEYCRNNTITYKDPTGHNICPTQRDLYHKYKEEGMSPQEAYQKMRKELGLDSKSGYKDSGVGNGKDPWRSYGSGSNTTATERRNSPGVVEGNGRNTSKMMYGTDKNAGVIPKEIADKLREKQYNNFDEFRNDFWKAVAETDYANEFLINGDPKNYYRMKNGGAPLVVSNQAINGSFTYQLHHIIPINQGGSVYSVDNLVVVTPRYHAEILIPEVHGYNGFKQFFR